ncbi:TPA: hypothetical protein ACHYJV_005060, partial [Escherichia coli]
TGDKNIFILYTVPSLSVYVPLNNTNQDSAIINYQALDKLDNQIKHNCFRTRQDDNLVLGVVWK